jgi:hypothetical protein
LNTGGSVAYNLDVPQQERDRVVAQIAELKATLRLAQSYDVREAIRLAIDDSEQRLAELKVELVQTRNPAAA